MTDETATHNSVQITENGNGDPVLAYQEPFRSGSPLANGGETPDVRMIQLDNGALRIWVRGPWLAGAYNYRASAMLNVAAPDVERFVAGLTEITGSDR